MSEMNNPEIVGVDFASGPDQTAIQNVEVNGKVDNSGKVVPFPSTDVPQEDTPSEEVQEENKDLIEDPDQPLSQYTEAQIKQMLKMTQEMVQMMEQSWIASKREFKITDDHMKVLYQYNEEHKTIMPDYITDEEREKWDHFNGLNNITEEDAVRIFGADSPVIGLTHDITKDRIRSLIEDYFNWLSALREYKNIYQGYMKLIELQEEKNIEELKLRAEAEKDPETKQKMLDAIELYYNRKYLKFLAEPLDEQDRNRVIHAFNTEKTIEYWLKRSQDKLKQLKMNTKFILECSQFEKRYLPEKYHKQSNILLLYFMMTIIYCRCSDHKDPGRNKAVCMIMAIDQIVQNIMEPDKRKMVLDNIMAFEDQFMEFIPEQPANTDAE